MYLVTLEGLPHAGRACILRQLAHQRPGWTALDVKPDPATACSWASSECRANHALFAALACKMRALGGGGDDTVGKIVLLNTPWFEHMPRHQSVLSLASDMTHELVARLGVEVRAHIMIMLGVPHDETFEQIVCYGNPYWNTTSLADVVATQGAITQHLLRAQAGTAGHPFTCATYQVHCPPFFEENEVVVKGIKAEVINFVNTVIGVDKALSVTPG